MNQQNQSPKKLLDQLSETLRTKHYSLRTEQTYIAWVRRYILFHDKRHPREMGAAEINQFVSHLAVERNVSASTQNQALSAVLFLYRYVLKIELDESVISDLRPAKSKHIPTMLSKEEAKAVIENMQGIYRLMAQILYGSGLRLMECLRLRVKDLDFANHQTCAELVEASSSATAKPALSLPKGRKRPRHHVPRCITRTIAPPPQPDQSPARKRPV
jgi:site-specific recombinase XerD